MDKIRLRYVKKGKAMYIAHLDLMATMHRALLRAGVSLKYSEGFNPRPYISVALPSPVASESECELMDIALRGGGIRDRVNAFMPEGLRIQKAYRGFRNFSEIKWIKAQCSLVYDGFGNAPDAEALAELADVLSDCFSAKSLIISKKTKRGVTEIDALQHIQDAVVERGGDGHGNECIVINAVISAQNPTISSKDFSAIAETAISGSGCGIAGPDFIKIKRIEIYDANMLLFK